MAHKEFLIALNSDPNYHEFYKEVLVKSIPVVPEHDPEKDNTELWKAKSAEKRGYLACLNKLKNRSK